MSDELCFGSQGWNVPYGTGGIDTGSNDETRRQVIPVERRQGCRVLRRLRVRQKGKWG